MAPKSYREWSPFQAYLLPPSPTDWLPEDDLAYFILDIVEQLDLSEVEAAIQAKDSRGNRPHDPRMMTALLVVAGTAWAFGHRARSSFDLPRCGVSGHRWRQPPRPQSISEFRRQHLSALKVVFLTTVRMAQQLGLAKLGRVALDGTKVEDGDSRPPCATSAAGRR